MTELKLPADGSCRCGRVHFRISKPPILTMVCHCRGCQKMTASAYRLSAAIPGDGFEVSKGEPVFGVLHGGDAGAQGGSLAGEDFGHYFGGWCMSWMFTRPPPALGDFVNIRVTLMDDTAWFTPFMETQTAEKLPWVTTPAARTFERFPSMEEFGGLIAEYAGQGRVG